LFSSNPFDDSDVAAAVAGGVATDDCQLPELSVSNGARAGPVEKANQAAYGAQFLLETPDKEGQLDAAAMIFFKPLENGSRPSVRTGKIAQACNEALVILIREILQRLLET
jgi:hypothetical protein